MTDKMIPVPRELLEIHRAWADLLYRAALIKRSQDADAILSQRVQADALLRAAAQPEPITPKQLAKMVTENPDLQFSVTPTDEELRRDAERYRWLRDSRRLVGNFIDEHESNICVCSASGEDILWSQQLDDAIDAAIAAEKREG